MKKIVLYTLVVLMLAGTTACKKSLLDLKSQNGYDYGTYFATNDVMNQAVIATYATLLHNGLIQHYMTFDLLGYEAKKTTNLQGD